MNINYFRKLFGLGECNPPIPYPLMPVVEQNKDISEPVYSFIECVRNNPKRFTTTSDFSVPDLDVMTYTIKDNRTKESWKVSFYRTYSKEFSHVMHKPSYITNDEAKYLLEQIRNVYSARVKRKQEILQQREERVMKKERQRLMEIYK